MLENSENKPQGLYFSKALFLRCLFLEGLIFSLYWANLIVGKEIYHFCFLLLCIWGQLPSTSPQGGLDLEGPFNRGFFALRVWGACIWRGLYMEFMVLHNIHPGHNQNVTAAFPKDKLESKFFLALQVLRGGYYWWAIEFSEKVRKEYRRTSAENWNVGNIPA